MVVKKRKKSRRLIGNRTYGGGVKKHRGAGNKGGRGLSGTGKRADQKKPVIWKKKYFGKHGFKKKGVKEIIKAINIGYIDGNIDKFVLGKKIKKEGNFYVVNLLDMGFNKLLGSGGIKNKFKITTKYASKNAVEKVKKMGGVVEIINK